MGHARQRSISDGSRMKRLYVWKFTDKLSNLQTIQRSLFIPDYSGFRVINIKLFDNQFVKNSAYRTVYNTSQSGP